MYNYRNKNLVDVHFNNFTEAGKTAIKKVRKKMTRQMKFVLNVFYIANKA